MKKLLFPTLFLIGLILFACSPDDNDGTFFPDAPANPDQAKLVQLLNNARTAGQNCGSTNMAQAPAVTWNDTLAAVARNHSIEMDAVDKLSHTGTNGSFLDDRLDAVGYVYTQRAENLLKGGATEEEAIEIWLNSPEHCLNIMNPDLLEIGVGTSGPYWTLILASH